jgi:hypothetical protein
MAEYYRKKNELRQ